MTKEQILQQCRVDGLTVKLPDVQLDRNLYLEVSKALGMIGGKWKGGKTQGFVFQTDPTELLNQIAAGEKRNLKKEFQFFGTPADLADELVALAELEQDSVVLEPSAGQGAIVEAVLRVNPKANVYAVELMDVNSMVLTQKRITHEKGDFLSIPLRPVFDRIIANPPFAKNQDIDHVKRMYEVLKPGGRLVSIMSPHWIFAEDNKSKRFREWVDEVDAETIEIDRGRFKDSGTMVGAVIVVIDK